MTEAGRDVDWNFLSRYQYQLRAVFGQGRGVKGFPYGNDMLYRFHFVMV